MEWAELMHGNGRWSRAVLQGAAILLLATLVGLGVNRMRPQGLPLVGDWSPAAQLAELHGGEEAAIPLEEARALFFTKGAVFVDARPGELFGAGHIPGALNLPWDEFETRFQEVMGAVPVDSIVITYCDGEACTLSREVAVALEARGYSQVRVLVNGWTVWQQANLPKEG